MNTQCVAMVILGGLVVACSGSREPDSAVIVTDAAPIDVLPWPPDAKTVCTPPADCDFYTQCPPNGPWPQICYSNNGGFCEGCRGTCGDRCYTTGDCLGTSDCCGAGLGRPGVCSEGSGCRSEQVCREP